MVPFAKSDTFAVSVNYVGFMQLPKIVKGGAS
jgi:hypothetical protein